MKRKMQYSTMVILNPQWGFASSSQRKTLVIYDDGIRLGNEDILYDQMMNCRFEDPCVKLWDGKKNLLFGIQNRVGGGKVTREGTSVLVAVLQSACSHNQQNFRKYISILKRRDRREHLHMYSKAVFVIASGLAFGVFYEWFLPNPMRLLFVPVFVVFGNILMSILFKTLGNQQDVSETH